MRPLSRRTALYATAATVVLATGTAGLAAGTPLIGDPLRSPTTQAQTAKGDVVAGDNNFHLVYSATRAKGADETKATGTFVGEAKVAGNRIVKFGGPITCLYVKGNTASFFYPITSSDPAVVASLGAGVYVYVESDGKGAAKAFNFLPVPAKTTDGCYPLPALVPATGKATSTGG